jgi:hypothetical protein
MNGGTIDAFCEIYFCTFHCSLPIIDKDEFYNQLGLEPFSSHFSVLVLSMILKAQLSSQAAETAETPGGLFLALKNLHSTLQSTGKVSIELIQSGVLIASYEYCQAVGQDAWLSIGVCARMGHILGLHHTIKPPASTGEGLGDRVAIKDACGGALWFWRGMIKSTQARDQ